MAKLTHGQTVLTSTASWEGTNEQDTKIKNYHFDVGGKFVDQDIDLKVTVKDATGSIGLSGNTAGKATAAISDVHGIGSTTAPSTGTAGTDYYEIKATASGTAGSVTPRYTVSTAGWIGANKTGSATSVSVTGDTTGKSVYINKSTVGTSATVTTTPVVTPSIGGTITSASTITTTAPSSGTDGTDYFTIDPSGSVTTTGKATPYKTATAGYTPTVSKTAGTAANITPDIADGTNYYLPITELTNSIVSGTNKISTTDKTDTLSVKVEIPAGYHKGVTLTKDFTDLLPNLDSDAGASHIRSGYKAYNDAGQVITGTMTEKSAATYYATTSDQTISANQFLAGAQTISKLSSSNYSAANIKHNVTVSVSNGSTNVYSQKGTFTSASTVSSGQTAAAAAQIRSGYSAWVDGSEVKGSIADATTSSTNGTVTVTGGSASVSGMETTTTNTGFSVSATGGSASVTASSATVSAGYLASSLTASTTAQSKSGATDTKYIKAQSLPTATSSSATSGATQKLAVTLSTSADQYINIGTGYQNANVYYKIPKISGGSASVTANQTITPEVKISALNTTTNKYTISATGKKSITGTVSTAGYISSVSSADVSLSGGSVTVDAAGAPTAGLVSTTDTTTYPSGYSELRLTAKAGYNDSAKTSTVNVYQGTFTVETVNG